jgi:hypothetical protein
MSDPLVVARIHGKIIYGVHDMPGGKDLRKKLKLMESNGVKKLISPMRVPVINFQ